MSAPAPTPSDSSQTNGSHSRPEEANSSDRHSHRDRRRSRSRSRDGSRSSHRRHRRRSRSSSPSPSRSRSRSRKRSRREKEKEHSRSRDRSRSKDRRRRRRTRSRSRSRSRTRSRERSPRRKTTKRRSSRSRSASRQRKIDRSRSRERKERHQHIEATTPATSGNEQRRPITIVTRDQREHLQQPKENPLERRPPPPPQERPESLLSHVTPAARGKYAYVMLVMKGDSYATGAIITAYSLKLTGTPNALVCMVTPDVTEACRKRMRYVFTEVVEIPYLQYEVKPLRTQKQRNMYNSWVDAAFTKWNMLSLIQYEKTLFVDADKIVLANMDHLFTEMSTPAGTFSSPWSEPFVERKDAISQRQGKGGGRGKYGNSKGMMNPYKNNGHNTRVTSAQIYSALTEQSFVVIGTVVLLSPNMEDYEQYKLMLTQLVPFGFQNCHSMMDEQSLSYYFAIWKNGLIQRGEYGKLTATASSPAPVLPANAYSEWSYIHHCYNYVPWHRYWLAPDEVPYVFHFFNLKPWDSDRKAYLDLEAWWELAMAMLKDPSLSTEAREDLKTIYPEKMLALPKIEGCCWCRLTEESFMLPQDGKWKQHNVFDADGHLACPVMKEGFERNAKKRAEAVATGSAAAAASSR